MLFIRIYVNRNSAYGARSGNTEQLSTNPQVGYFSERRYRERGTHIWNLEILPSSTFASGLAAVVAHSISVSANSSAVTKIEWHPQDVTAVLSRAII